MFRHHEQRSAVAENREARMSNLIKWSAALVVASVCGAGCVGSSDPQSAEPPPEAPVGSTSQALWGGRAFPPSPGFGYGGGYRSSYSSSESSRYYSERSYSSSSSYDYNVYGGGPGIYF